MLNYGIVKDPIGDVSKNTWNLFNNVVVSLLGHCVRLRHNFGWITLKCLVKVECLCAVQSEQWAHASITSASLFNQIIFQIKEKKKNTKHSI